MSFRYLKLSSHFSMELEHLHIASICGYRSNYNIMLYCKS
nr:MAG TPA: hypothetical protein [Caudoviricetes sp.]